MSVGAAIAALHTLLAFYALSDRWTPALTLVATALLLWSLYSAGRRIYLMDNVQKSDVERR